jgi:hypothetical protein
MRTYFHQGCGMRTPEVLRAAAVICLAIQSVSGQTAAAPYAFTISASQPWTDTGVDLVAGDTLTLTAEKKSGHGACSPDGTAKSSAAEKLPMAVANEGALIARTSEIGDALLIGSSKEIRTDAAGHLFLGVNQVGTSDCAFGVKLTLTHGASAANSAAPRTLKDQLTAAARVWTQGQFGAGSAAGTGTQANAAAGGGTPGTSANAAVGLKLPAVILDGELKKHIDELPRRVHDHAGNPGDMLNFVIIGSEERVQAALTAAEWHLADVDSKEAGLKAVLNTYQKKDYLEMPMSHLYLFDRMQDFGYEQAQAYSVVASRHHFRLWKAPFTWNNETVWVGAGTHDIGFEKDIRTGKLTHKIDPAVDGERENIAQSLDKSGKTKSIAYYLPPEPVQDAKNASGGGYHSDGRLLVVFLK